MYKDSFGLDVTYGLGEGKDLNGAVSEIALGAIHQLSVSLVGEDMPSASNLTIRSAKIPAGSAILSAYLVVSSAAATAATTVDVGTVELDGTAIDEDGLLDGAELSAGVKAGGDQSEALIDTIVAKDSYIKIAPSATGAALVGLKAKLIVEYI